jgi:DNA polymerase III alpha subunit
MTSPFVQLHVHSSYSPIAGIPSLAALCLAAQQQASALALTDTNGLYGIIRFIELAREAGLRPRNYSEASGKESGSRSIRLLITFRGMIMRNATLGWY